jgi:hypothetical protein
MTKDEALKMALEVMRNQGDVSVDEWIATEKAIKEALANEALEKMAENARELGLDYEPEQPKVRTGNCLRVGVCASEGHKIAPQRTWVGLTEEELYEIYDESDDGSSPCGVCGACSKCKIEVAIAKAIEAKLKEKNT